MHLPSDAEILDVGAGTGNVGKRLRAVGVQNPIDAVDACEKFLAALQATGCYREHKCEFLGYGKLPEAEKVGKYDLVTASGVFLSAHMPKESFKEILDYLKVGGHFITAMREFYYAPGEKCGYYDALKELREAGRIELVKTESFERGSKDQNNKMLQPQQSILLHFRKTA